MDDNIKKNGEGSNEELENLAELFQEELDKTKAEAEKKVDNDLVEHISDWDGVLPTDEVESEEEEKNTTEESEEIDDSELCECCGEHRKDKNVSEDYPYCSECREAMKRYPIRWTIWLLIVPVALCFVFAAVSFFTTTLPNFSVVSALDRIVAQKHLNAAETSFYNYRTAIMENENFTPSVAAYRYAIKQEIKMYYSRGIEDVTPVKSATPTYAISYAENLIGSYYTLDELDNFGNRQIKRISKKISVFYDTLEEVQTVLGGAEQTYVASCEVLDSMIADSEKEYDKALLEFFKYNMALSYGESSEIQLESLLKVREANSSYYWLYEQPLFQAYFALGKYDEALSTANAYKQRNAENSLAYAMEASVYRMKKEYDKAVEICNEGIIVDDTNDECYRQLAIVRLLEGDYDSAHSSAKLAYDNAISLASFNVYAICCHLKGDTEGYNEIVENLERYNSYYNSQSYVLSPSVEEFIAGKVTLENIFLEGMGDVK